MLLLTFQINLSDAMVKTYIFEIETKFQVEMFFAIAINFPYFSR
jgi:hypothetical protein